MPCFGPAANPPSLEDISGSPLSGSHDPVYGQLLRPYPEYTSVGEVQNLADTAATMHSSPRPIGYSTMACKFLVSYMVEVSDQIMEGRRDGHKRASPCPRRIGMTRLWRNLLLPMTLRSLVVRYVCYELPVGKGRKLAPSAAGGRRCRRLAGSRYLYFQGWFSAITNSTNNLIRLVAGSGRISAATLPIDDPWPIYKFQYGRILAACPFYVRCPSYNSGKSSRARNLNSDITLQKYWRDCG